MSVNSPVKKVPIHLQSAQNRLLIKGGRVVNDDLMVDTDVYIEDGIIRQVGKDLIIPGGTRTIEAKGKYVIPGGIDPHTHFQFPFMGSTSADDFYQGTKAALAGGTTMIMDFVVPPRQVSLIEAYDQWRSWADEKVCCDYALHVAVTYWSDRVGQEMEQLTTEKGINSFKAFMAYKDELQLPDVDILRMFQKCRQVGALGMVHAENADVIEVNQKSLLKRGITGPEGHLYSRDEEIEAEATNRAIVFANQVNCPVYIVHVMSKMSGDVIAEKKRKGCIVFGEAISPAIGSNGSNYFNRCWRHSASHVMTPPIRTDPSTPDHLIDLMATGDIETFGSDHCSWMSSQKAMGKDDFTKIPSGVNGVEERMMVLWEKAVVNGKIDPCKFVALTSTNAAKIFNIYPRKGRIAVGSDADVVIWDPSLARTISSKTHQSCIDFNIYEGTVCHGAPWYVISNGRVVMEEGQLHVVQGLGRFINTPPFAQQIYYRVQERERSQAPQKVNRDAYDGPVQDTPPRGLGINGSPRGGFSGESPLTPSHADFHSRPPTRGGSRHLQDSSFSLSGAQIDDSKGTRPGIKVNNPPGGRSSVLW